MNWQSPMRSCRNIVFALGRWILVSIFLPPQLIHGLGHAMVLMLVTWDVRKLSLDAITEQRSLSQLLRFHPSILKEGQLEVPNLSSFKTRCVSSGGILLNLISIEALLWALQSIILRESDLGDGMLLLWIWSGGFILASWASMFSLPDWLGILFGKTPYWACGPAFVIRQRESGHQPSEPILSERLLSLAEILAREASTRGGQSGGFSVLSSRQGEPSIIFDKVVKGKREDIVRILMDRLRRLIQRASVEHYRPAIGFEAVLMHLRYATGGATHWHNAQPHWFEYFDHMMSHRIAQGVLHSEAGEVFNMIAHNGDMDGVYLEVTLERTLTRLYFTQSEARAFLTRAMPWTSSEGNSDSRSVAEWVDFHLTQGLAAKALRYAWFTRALDYNQDIAQPGIPDPDFFSWGEVIDLTMVQEKREGLHLSCHWESLRDLPSDIRSKIKAIVASNLPDTIPPDRVTSFLEAFEQAFFNQDLAWVMRRASRDFVGEFALMICTTVEARMGVFCLTQAFSLGYNQTLGEIFGSAEPQGVTSALQQGEPEDDVYQIYLKDGQYALIEYRAPTNTAPIRIFDRAEPDDPLTDLPMPSPSAMLHLVPEGRGEGDWFPVNQNPLIPRFRASGGENLIAKDLSEIPYVLSLIRSSFEPGGENLDTMTHFTDLVLGNLMAQERDADSHDLVLYGVDFNQDLLQEFALALRAILPGLRVRAENAGNVLKEIKRSKREGIGPYGKHTVFLGVSNSAQTQSTLAAARRACALVGQERSFVLSQSLLNSMSEAIGQRYQPGAPRLPNTFINLSDRSPDGTSGRRRAEAATVVIVATQAVLTEILLHLTERAILHFETMSPEALSSGRTDFRLRPDLEWIDLNAFREFQTAIYEIDIPNRIGVNRQGEEIESPDHVAIHCEAEARAENQVEFVRAYALFAAYIFFATIFGAPVFAVALTPLGFIPGIGILAHVLDACLFLSALWLIHLGLRWWQGRPIFERMGARAEVFIDRRYIARIIERYNATLFSNAPAFITPFFYWADTVQDALHRYGIRAHRGVVTIHRTPDERMGIEEANNASEENMVYAQLGGIYFNHGQPQSRDKVRKGSIYEDAARPFQTVLSDSLLGLRAHYDGRLSPECMRLINRRLIDLADGLVTEFTIGYLRREIVNESIWSVLRWIPGIQWFYNILLANDIDLRNLSGDADTANQAQIQSTKHPVSPMDSHVVTMRPRSTFNALRSEDQAEEDPFAVLSFSDDGITLHFNRSAMQRFNFDLGRELHLRRGKAGEYAEWVPKRYLGQVPDRFGRLEERQGSAVLAIYLGAQQLELLFPIETLSDEQRAFLLGGDDAWLELAA